MSISEWSVGMTIVGGGPAGIAILLAAHKSGKLQTLLDQGIAIIEKSDGIGAGTLGNYEINSDSSGQTFLDCLLGHDDTPLTRLRDHPLALRMAAAGDGAVSLANAGAFLALIGETVAGLVTGSAGQVLRRHEALGATRTQKGWRLTVRDLDTSLERTLHTRTLVLATGARQPAERLDSERVGSHSLVQRAGSRLLQSDTVLGQGGLALVAQRLAQGSAQRLAQGSAQRSTRSAPGRRTPKIVVVGGSTSAVACCTSLLSRAPEIGLGEKGLSLLHRRPLRIYYPDRASARADGYTEWSERDVCPVSGKVFRFAGFRLDSRELIMQARGTGGRAPEPRLHLHQIGIDDAVTARLIDEADLVVAAFGYRPRALPLHDIDGRPFTVLSQTGPQQPMVDSGCRVLDERGVAIPRLFGIGLGAGFLPRGRLGGEASFKGQANGLWLWQHDVGKLIVDAALKPVRVRSSGAIRVACPGPALAPLHTHLRPTAAVSAQLSAVPPAIIEASA